MTPGDIVIGWLNGLSGEQYAVTVILMPAATAVGIAIATLLGGPRPPTGGATV